MSLLYFSRNYSYITTSLPWAIATNKWTVLPFTTSFFCFAVMRSPSHFFGMSCFSEFLFHPFDVTYSQKKYHQGKKTSFNQNSRFNITFSLAYLFVFSVFCSNLDFPVKQAETTIIFMDIYLTALYATGCKSAAKKKTHQYCVV